MQNVKIECTPQHNSPTLPAKLYQQNSCKMLGMVLVTSCSITISGKSSPSFHADVPLLLQRTTLCHSAHLSTPEKLGSAYSTFKWCYWYGNCRKTLMCVCVWWLCSVAFANSSALLEYRFFCVHYYPSFQWHCYMWILFVLCFYSTNSFFGFPAACNVTFHVYHKFM
jgi:hypothetical protein